MLTIRSHRLHQNNPSVTWGRLRMVDRRWGLIVTDHACPLWELASTPVHCWLLIGFAVLSAVACLHRRRPWPWRHSV